MSDLTGNEITRAEEGEYIGLEVDAVIPDEEIRRDIVEYLTTELDQVMNDRSSAEDNWKTWRRQRLARPEQKTKNYPWADASNQAVPLAATNTNSLYAMTKDKFGNRRPLISVSTEDKMFYEHAEALTRLVDKLMESKHHVNIRKKNLTIFYDLVSLGTQFVKVPWSVKKWSFKREGQQVEKVVQDSPDVIPIPIDDFFCKLHMYDMQTAPWVAIRTRYQEHELRQQEANGIFQNVELVLNFNENTISEHVADQLDQMDETSTLTDDTKEYEIFETYLFWDIDGDGVPEDIKLWIHKDAKVILRAEFNELGVRDLVRIPYFNIPYQLYGLGVGHMVEKLQDEVDTLHNIRINSQHLSSLQGFITRTGSTSLDNFEFEPLFNLKTEVPKEDVQLIKFPDVSANTFQAEYMVTEYADRLTGAGNAMMGQSDNQAKTRATASGTMFLAQQGYKLYESISKNIEEGYGEIGLMIVYQLVSNAERAIQSILPLAPLEDQELLREVLQMNVEDIPSRFNFTIQVTEVDKTEEAKLQKAMTMQQLYGAYTETVMNLAERIQMIKQMAPEMLEPAMKLYVGQTKIMEEIIDLLSDKNPEEFTVYVKDIDLLLRKDEMAKDQQVQQMKGALNASQQGQVPTQMPGGGAGAVGNPNVPTTVPNVPQGAGGEEAGGMVEPVS
jgi:hypothetical protein